MALESAEESKIIKAKKLQEKEDQKKRQTEIDKLLTHADIAIELQGWALAKEKLEKLLALAPEHAQAQVKLELAIQKINKVDEQKAAQKEFCCGEDFSISQIH